MATWSNEVFATNLRYYMERSGRTQKDLAEIAGVSAPTFNDWVKGKKLPRMDKIERLAIYFGIEMSDLIEDKKEKPAKNDGLSKDKQQLIDFVKTVPEDKASMILAVIRTIAEAD